VVHHSFLRILFDTLYFLLPTLLVLAILANSKFQYFIAVLNSIFNFIYALLLSLLSFYSIEGFVGWILLPLIFAFKNEMGFYYALNSVRYIFLLIFFSAGVWKIRAGGIFNLEQMSGILAMQHVTYIAGNTEDWFTKTIKYLIVHNKLSYILYLSAAMAAVSFFIDFCAKKFDKLLIIIFFVCFVRLCFNANKLFFTGGFSMLLEVF
jgi:hypothetical protein